MLRLNLLLTLLISICLFDATVIAQTSSEVRKKLGIPAKESLQSNLLEETYQVDPNLSLSVYYGEDKRVCMLVKATTNLKHTPAFRLEGESLSAEEKSRQSFDVLLDSLLKRAEWGKEIEDKNLLLGHRIGNCINTYRAEYENISVNNFGSVCGENAPFEIFRVEWKRDQCKKVREAKTNTTN